MPVLCSALLEVCLDDSDLQRKSSNPFYITGRPIGSFGGRVALIGSISGGD